MTGRKPGYVYQTQNGLWRYSGFYTCTSTPAAHSASCFCKQEAVEQAGMQIISFLPFTFSYLIFFPLTFMQGLAVLNISSA